MSLEDGNYKYSKDGDRVGKWVMYNQDGEEIESVNY